ncbi:MAG TPA: hypothetical protein VFO30_08005 [Chthoniobacterales bacterium]|nr:hypothetical protein [Chthoniobacterales bacterium]
MKPGTITHTLGVLLSSVSSLFAHSAPTQGESAKVKMSKRSEGSPQPDGMLSLDSIMFPPGHLLSRSSPPASFSTPGSPTAAQSAQQQESRFPWKCSIVTTVFWIGEEPTANNPVPNRASSWDKQWTKSYGGFDDPNPAHRRDFIPVKFTPRQNPFYCALPYNDKAGTGHKPEAPHVVPWFNQAYQGPGVSTCKGHWVEIRKGNRVAYAQWEDAGPFRTDHWQYVFGDERPKPNLNKGAGLDISPAVRDYLGLAPTDVTDWRFVDFSEVPRGPWAKLGENNTFVMNERQRGELVAQAKTTGAGQSTAVE